MVVDTSLVEIGEGSSLLNDDIDSSKKDISNPRENTPLDRNSLNQGVFKNEPLLPTDDDVNRRDSNLDLRDKTKLCDDDTLDEDNIHSVSGSFIPDNDSAVLLTEKGISVDGILGQASESSSLEEHGISLEGSSSRSQLFVEEPDLSHEMFETLWMQLPET